MRESQGPRKPYRGDLPPDQRPKDMPMVCFEVLPSDECQVIKITWGESGFKNVKRYATVELAKRTCDVANKELSVSWAQRQAMLGGSMFGWTVPGARPGNYKPAHDIERSRSRDKRAS
jgi:hypothetical protein